MKRASSHRDGNPWPILFRFGLYGVTERLHYEPMQGSAVARGGKIEGQDCLPESFVFHKEPVFPGPSPVGA